MIRSIAHIDLDTFFVSCERLVNSQLENIPIIIGGSSDRGVVASCSYEARQFGVRSAMPMRFALQLCPEARVVKGDMELYSKKSQLVTEILSSEAPLLEKASIDEFYMDVSGMDKFFGTYHWTDNLVKLVEKETGLPLTFGLSINKTVSKMATTEAKPHGKPYIGNENVQGFLNPLSVKKIPMIGSATYQVLSRIGIRRIQTLAEMPVSFLEKLLGKNGLTIWKKANGKDEAPVVPYVERKSISTEQTFLKDTMDLHGLRALLVKMVEKLAFQLRKEGKLTSIVAVKVRYSNFDTHTQQCRLPYTSSDHILIKNIHGLFDKVYERRMMLRLIGVRFSGLVRGHYQIDLFSDTPQMISLYQAMDKMKARYGKDVVMRGICMDALKRDNTKPVGCN